MQGNEIYALFDKHHKESYSLYSISCLSGWVYRYIYIIYTYSFILCYTGPIDTSPVTEGVTLFKY